MPRWCQLKCSEPENCGNAHSYRLLVQPVKRRIEGAFVVTEYGLLTQDSGKRFFIEEAARFNARRFEEIASWLTVEQAAAVAGSFRRGDFEGIAGALPRKEKITAAA